MMCRDRGIAQVFALVLFFPVTLRGSAISDPSLDTTLLRGADVAWCWKHYLSSGSGGPYAAPGESGTLENLPPTLIVHGTRDPVAVTIPVLERRLVAAGVETETWVCAGLPHAFTVFQNLTGVAAIVHAAARWLSQQPLALGSKRKP
jgi:acetyl esterase/lipase